MSFYRKKIYHGSAKTGEKKITFIKGIKGGYLDFSHLNELVKIYITEIYRKKQYKSSRIKNHKTTKIIKIIFFDGIPFKGGHLDFPHLIELKNIHII